MYELVFETDFAAAHFLREYRGKCERIHGHNWKVAVALRSPELDETGMVIDFHDAREIVSQVLGRLDHSFLNELEEFAEVNPTTENLARIIYREVAARLDGGVEVARVTCWESQGCSASYFE